MKPPPFKYWAPRTLDEAMTLLADKPNAYVLAGGQSMMAMLNFRLVTPEHLVDLNRVEGLSFIRGDAEALEFGSMTRQRDIEFSPLVAERLPLLAEAIRRVGHRQTRNRGTIGGSLCHLDPSAELPTVAMAMDATLRIESRQGLRTLPMASFPAGMMTSALVPGEVLTSIRIAAWRPGHGHGFVEFARRHGDFAVASAAALIDLDNEGVVLRVSLTVGGVCAAPSRVTRAEDILIGKRPNSARIAEAAQVCGEIEALDDAIYPAWYRRRLATTLSGRALDLALSRAKVR